MVVTDFDYERRKEYLDNGIKSELAGLNHWEDGWDLDELGKANPRFDYRTIQIFRSLRVRRDNLRFLPSTLEFYWQNGIDEKAMKFLDDGQFFTRYEYVRVSLYKEAFVCVSG